MSYVVAQPAGIKSPKLYKIKQNGGKTLGVIPDHEMWSAQPIEIRAKEIIVHLGDDPPIGSVYGTWIEPIYKRINIKGYGEVYNYADLSEIEEIRLLKAFPIALERVQKLGPQCDWDMLTEIRNPRGNRNGLYKYKPKGADILTYYQVTGQAPRVMVKVIGHELAHGVWFRYLDSGQRSRWIKLYEKYVGVKEISTRDVEYMIKDMRQIASVRDYIKDAEPETQAAAAIFLQWLKSVHTIKPRELQDLLESGSSIPVPNTHLHRSDVQCPITLYSKSSAPEMFAEAMSSFIVGDLANKKIASMLKDLT